MKECIEYRVVFFFLIVTMVIPQFYMESFVFINENSLNLIYIDNISWSLEIAVYVKITSQTF